MQVGVFVFGTGNLRIRSISAIALIVPAVHLLGRSDGQAPAPGGQLELSL
jgi:hypothetical protein